MMPLRSLFKIIVCGSLRQINMRIDEAGIALTSYAPRKLFPGRPQAHVAALRGGCYAPYEAAAAPSAALEEQGAQAAGVLPVLASAGDVADMAQGEQRMQLAVLPLQDGTGVGPRHDCMPAEVAAPDDDELLMAQQQLAAAL